MKIVHNKSGVSLIFVLAVMLMLLSIGVSALSAASLNYGAGLAQRERSQAHLYVSSMEQTVKAALMDMGSLGGAVLNMALDEALNSSTKPLRGKDDELEMEIYKSGEYKDLVSDMPIDARLTGLSDTRLGDYEISIDVTELYITVNKPIVDKTYDDTDGSFDFAERTLQAGTVSGRIVVRLTTNFNARNTYRIVTETTYRFDGCAIAEEADDDDDLNDAGKTGEEDLWDLVILGPIDLTVEKYETLDTTS